MFEGRGDAVERGAAEDQSARWRVLAHRLDYGAGAAPRVAGLRAMLVDHGGADLFEHRPVVADALVDRLVGESGVGVGAEGSGFDGQHADAESGHLVAQRVGDSFDRVLGGAVVAEIRSRRAGRPPRTW
ncbi:hypothetical protein OG767_17100 [Micromonospora sp. NBC_01392]